MLHHSHTPRNTSPNEGLTELGASSHFYLFISGFRIWLGAGPVHHLDPSYDWLETRRGSVGVSCCQAPRRICCSCDSSTAGLESVFSLSQIGGMSTDFHTQPVGPAIHLSRQWKEHCRPTHFLQNVPLIWTSVCSPESLSCSAVSLKFLKYQCDIFISTKDRPPPNSWRQTQKRIWTCWNFISLYFPVCYLLIWAVSVVGAHCYIFTHQSQGRWRHCVAMNSLYFISSPLFKWASCFLMKFTVCVSRVVVFWWG